MRTIGLLITVALLCGLLTATLIAWVQACLPARGGNWPLERAEWPGAVPAGWPRVLRDVGEEALAADGVMLSGNTRAANGAAVIEVRAARCDEVGRVVAQDAQLPGSEEAGEGIINNANTPLEVFTFERRTYGWPWGGLCTDVLDVDSGVATGPSIVTQVWDSSLHRGIPFPPARSMAGRDVRLPVKVVWVPMTMSVAALGALWAAPLLGAMGARAWRRSKRRRGLRCEFCGYSLVGVLICPECGKDPGVVVKN